MRRSQGRASTLVITHCCQPTRRVNAVVLWCVVEHIPLIGSGENMTTDHEVLPRILMSGNEERDWSPSIGHFNRFAGRNPGEVATGVLAKLSDPDPFHVLHSSISICGGVHPWLRSRWKPVGTGAHLLTVNSRSTTSFDQDL